MAQKNESGPVGSGASAPKPQLKDPWAAFGYMISGVAVYGLLGWGLDRWLGTSFMVAIGIVAGAGLGIYMTMKALQPPSGADEHKN